MSFCECWSFEITTLEVVLTLKMENLAKLAKRAEMEDILASQAFHNEAIKKSLSSKRKGNDEDSNDNNSKELEADEWDTINIHMKKIHAKHWFNTTYHRHNPVFIDPRQPKPLHPPHIGCLFSIGQGPCKLYCLFIGMQLLANGTKQARLSNHSNEQPESLLLKELNLNQYHMEAPISSSPNKYDIEDYLDFLGVQISWTCLIRCKGPWNYSWSGDNVLKALLLTHCTHNRI
ncbi:hypothetical protein VP01_1551g3 [Puccinia sorghi]|uniref:Uncharacterized protein n=1 Tax=Puccinia sorghi TaxID=27349 RepID=A0A0L6VK01_9BASI|nr:hypothetical protein VP01_1551g3 [Puccinia sorghi]